MYLLVKETNRYTRKQNIITNLTVVTKSCLISQKKKYNMRLMSSGMLLHVTWFIVPDVLKEFAASMFRSAST
jgi:Na+/citrate or Na+/malate symporter